MARKAPSVGWIPTVHRPLRPGLPARPHGSKRPRPAQNAEGPGSSSWAKAGVRGCLPGRKRGPFSGPAPGPPRRDLHTRPRNRVQKNAPGIGPRNRATGGAQTEGLVAQTARSRPDPRPQPTQLPRRNRGPPDCQYPPDAGFLSASNRPGNRAATKVHQRTQPRKASEPKRGRGSAPKGALEAKDSGEQNENNKRRAGGGEGRAGRGTPEETGGQTDAKTGTH